VSERLNEMAAARRRSEQLARMRALARGQSSVRIQSSGPQERCDLCGTTVPDDHRHLLHLVERRIVCSCEACWALHSGDAEYRPSGMRTLWLDGFEMDDELWGRFQIPIALAFFMRSSVSQSVVAFYPSPAGATESELDLDAWSDLLERNPILSDLEPDAEALIVNRQTEPAQHAIVPIDECYRLVGLVKTRWEGISGGSAIGEAITEFFDSLRSKATSAAVSR
jgi:Family of unknown function (DUF5947)